MSTEHERQVRAAARDAEAAHDGIEEELAAMEAERDQLHAKMEPNRAKLRDLDARLDELKSPVHAKRMELAKLKGKQS